MSLRILVCACVAAALSAGSIAASEVPSFGELAGEFGLGMLGGVGGAAFAIAAVAELAPLVASPAASTAVVLASITLATGVGASAGVLAAADLLDLEAAPLAALSGGLLGGLLAALAEPFLDLLGVPAGLAEFLQFALLPTLPAVGATVAVNLAQSP